jgi:hypothetical protein
MQDIEALTASEMAIMTALANFRYLTTPQVVKLGVSPSVRHVQRVMRRLMDRARPLVGGLEHGAIPTIGRLHRIHFLTERGATILEDGGQPWETIHFPRKARLFPHDYWHRIDCVDFHIALARWAMMTGASIDFFHTYYDHGKIGSDGRAYPRSRVSWGDDALVPDAMFQITGADGVARLCAFEMHKGADTGRLTPKLKTYLEACRAQALEDCYGYRKSARVLLVFDQKAPLERLRERLARDGLLQDRGAQFFGKTLAEVATDFRVNWWPLDGHTTPSSLF